MQQKPLILFLLAGLSLTSAVQTSATSLTLSQILSDSTMQAMSGQSFGGSVAISGNYALVGAPSYDHSNGKVQLFDTTTGALLRTFDNPAASASSDYFGWSVAMDGNKVLIGAPSTTLTGGVAGRAFLFDGSSGSLLRTFTNPYANSPGDLFGWSVALQGDNVLIGAPLDDSNGTDRGLTYLFDANTGARLNSFSGPTGSNYYFGGSVDIDGNLVVIGQPLTAADFGSAFVYDISTVHLLGGVDTALLQHTLVDPFGSPGDRFGDAIAIDGNMIVVGAPRNDEQGNFAGRALLFDAASGAFLRYLDDPTVTDQERFGVAVDIDGNKVIIGAFGDDTSAPNVGQAYLFDADTGALLQSLDDPTLTSADFFGQSVAIAGGRVLVGAVGDDTQGTNIGQAYLFSPSSTTVPEPTGLALLGIGLAAMAALRQRRPRLASTNR